jgi:hypothetical protein
MLNDISYGIRDYTLNKSMGKMKKDFLDFIDKKTAGIIISPCSMIYIYYDLQN